jgi:epoxyqueuosine reductase QueG
MMKISLDKPVFPEYIDAVIIGNTSKTEDTCVMEDTCVKNINEKLLNEGCNTLIVAVFPYFYPEVSSGNTGVTSRYCRVYDYHSVIKEICDAAMKPYPYEYKVFTDISPFREKNLAAGLGLGEIGGNNLLLTEKYSSFVFIGEIAVKGILDDPTGLYARKPKKRICLRCNKCIDACPTGALGNKDSNRFNKKICLSYLSQKKNLSPYEEKTLAKSQSIWGCDICQNVCPLTLNAKTTGIEKFKNPVLDLNYDRLKSMTEEEFAAEYGKFAFAYKGIEILKRNIALHNK